MSGDCSAQFWPSYLTYLNLKPCAFPKHSSHFMAHYFMKVKCHQTLCETFIHNFCITRKLVNFLMMRLDSAENNFLSISLEEILLSVERPLSLPLWLWHDS